MPDTQERTAETTSLIDLQAAMDIATLKANLTRLDKAVDALTTALQKLSDDISDLKVSFEGVKTRLTMAIGVSVFLMGALAPVIVKSLWPAPVALAAPANAAEFRDLQKQMDRLELQIDTLSSAATQSSGLKKR
jgi:predicted  nucleic acid-binding Zn-ribbon protein